MVDSTTNYMRPEGYSIPTTFLANDKIDKLASYIGTTREEDKAIIKDDMMDLL